jgi:hypothetical protein
MNALTSEELDFLYECASDKLDDLLNGDWTCVRPQARRLHLLIAKLIELQVQAEEQNDE